MQWIADIKDTSPLYLVIQRDRKAGFYLYFYRNDFCIRDDLQDTFERAANQASAEYNVPTDSWKPVKGDVTKWSASIKNAPLLRFIIEQDKRAKYHVCIYRGNRKLYDYPNDSLDDAKNFALGKLRLPRLSWKQLG